MQMSATVLGKEYGLTGEEMNHILLKLGYIEGEPRNYHLTDKALDLAKEKDIHLGTGGYAHYNRYWTELTFDDSIKEQMDITPELIQEARKEVADSRAARYAAQAAARAKANEEFLAKQEAEKAAKEADELAAKNREQFAENCKKAGIVILIVGGTVVLTYGIYKIVLKVKTMKEEKAEEEQKETQNDDKEPVQ